MDQTILTIKGTVVTRKNLRKLRKSQIFCESAKRKRNLYYDIIEKKLGRYMSCPENPIPESYIPFEENYKESSPLLRTDVDVFEYDGTAAFEKNITYHLIHAEVNFP